MKDRLIDRLKELCDLDGVAGNEGAVRDFIGRYANPLANDIVTDPIGNLLVFKKGAKRPPKPVMMCAHMDEPGFRVHEFRDDGTLVLYPVGDIATASLPGTRVRIGSKRVRGVVALRRSGQNRKVPAPNELCVDIGADDKATAQNTVALADTVTLDSPWLDLASGRFKAKALENRIGCAVMMSLLEEELPFDTWFAFTACGTIRARQSSGRGAAVAVGRIDPGVLVLIGCKEATDFSELPEHRRFASLGKGAIVSFADTGTPYTRPLRERITKAADREEIKWQYPTSLGPSVTEARVAAVAASGAASACLSAPVRYMRTSCPVAELTDIEALYDVSRLAVAEAGEYHA